MFCKHCGNPLNEGQAFCGTCGKPAETVASAPVPAKAGGMHCPHCGSHDLYPVTSTETVTSTSGGGFSAGKGCLGYLLMGPFGLLCGACGSKAKTTTQTNTKNYWACRSCGKKFLDMDDLNAQLERAKSTLPRLLFGIVFGGVAFLALLIWVMSLGRGPDGIGVALSGTIFWLFIILEAVCVRLWLSTKKQITELEQEKEFLEKNAYGNHVAP